MFPDQEPEPDMPCWVDGVPINLHAVLSRTAVIGPAVFVGPADRRELVKHEAVMVDLSELAWRPKPIEASRSWKANRAASRKGRAAGIRNRWSRTT
jgi:hypothetical protein